MRRTGILAAGVAAFAGAFLGLAGADARATEGPIHFTCVPARVPSPLLSYGYGAGCCPQDLRNGPVMVVKQARGTYASALAVCGAGATAGRAVVTAKY